MSEYTDLMQFNLTPQGDLVVMVGDQKARTLADIMALTPNASPMNWADIVNQLAQEGDYELIKDPSAFRAEYEATLAEEDPEKGWSQDAMRLRDFGIPDFDEIMAPAIDSGTLVYFARDAYTGLPYRVELALGDATGEAPVYEPLTLKPTPEPPAEVPAVAPMADEDADVDDSESILASDPD